MIKVVQVYRKAKPGTYSIEGLFHTIGNELRKHVELIEYEMGKRNEIVKDWAKLRSLKADVYHITGMFIMWFWVCLGENVSLPYTI